MYSNRTKMKSLAVVATLLLGLSLGARAEDARVGDKVFSIGPRATYYNPQGRDNDNWYGGVQARVHLTPILAFEGSVDYRKNEYPEGLVIEGLPVQASALVYLTPTSRVSPFLLGGAGWYYTRVSGDSVSKSKDNRFGLHAGAGLEVMLTSFLSLDGSYRYIWLEDMTVRQADLSDKKYSDNSSMVTVALNVLF